MTCDERFCKDYLELKPEEATLLDLIRIIFAPRFDKRPFIRYRDAEYRDARKLRIPQYRWLIFISVLAQKLILYFKTPLYWTGLFLEFWLNLLSTHGGFFPALLNILKGNFDWPNASSETFRSVVGHLDQRVELDKNIRNGNRSYAASLSMMAAKLSYENGAFAETIVRDHWKMEFLGFFNFWNEYQSLSSTQAIMFHDTSNNPGLIMVAFRGTEPFNAEDWCTDLDISWCEHENVGKIHGGFMKALGLQKGQQWPKDIKQGLNDKPFAYYTIRQRLRDLLQKHEKAKFVVTGHSLGGALAILFVAILGFHEEEWLLERLEGVYTFGQPRVGDKKFGEFMEKKVKVYGVRYLRFVYCNDMVPRLPYDDGTLLFKHFGTCLYYNSCYYGNEVVEEPNKNYFSLLWLIPKMLNAVWELIRGFIIPCIEGPDYKEGWLLRVIRIIGLAIPGASAHAPEDYVNLTRLSPLPSSFLNQDPIDLKGVKHVKENDFCTEKWS